MLPSRESIALQLILEIAGRGGEARPSEHREGENAYQALAEIFRLTREDIDAEVKSGENKWENEVRWVRKKLVDEGYMDPSDWGVWKLTDKGQEVKVNRTNTIKTQEWLRK